MQEEQPSRVQQLEPDGEARKKKWNWVERAIWTDRMLEALETGVRGGKWHSLYDKVWRLSNLRAAWGRVKANKGGGGVDRMTIETFDKDAEARLKQLSESLRTRTYKPQPVRRTYVPKMGSKELRPLGIPTVTDRIVQTALRNVIEPIFEKEFDANSYGFRPERGCHDAIAQIERLLASGHHDVVDVDLRKYFDTIPKKGIMKEVAKRIADGNVLDLIESYLNQGVMEELQLWTPEKGTPQGAVISPLLANLYLHPVDVAMREAGHHVVRYADDMVVLCRTTDEAEEALRRLRELIEARELELHPVKTRLAHLMVRPGFQFLGIVFYDRFRDPRSSSVDKMLTTIKTKTKLTSGDATEKIITSINLSLRGFFNYFRICSRNSHAWKKIDERTRFRIRAILDKRRKGTRRRRRGRGHAHYRWPNAFFAGLGLFSLESAFKVVRQP